MAWIPGGTFQMGSTDGLADERPVHEVTVDGFWMDETEVTNAQFAAFVEATDYKTVAERPLNPGDFPGADPKLLVPGALVFEMDGGKGAGWKYQPNAEWRHPLGPGSSIEGKADHPVVQVAYEDALAYAEWAGKSLPTEAEWEFAARGGHDGLAYTWGKQLHPDGKQMANIWQGTFPALNQNDDGFLYTAPVKSFPPNDYGLYDISGNVWEWCLDWYRPDAYKDAEAVNPTGPKDSFNPDEPNAPARVLRGGSFLCAENYCRGYRPSTRMKSSPDTGLLHSGFRCIKRP